MKYLPIFNKGDKVKVNDKYPGLKSMKGEVYTIQAGPVKTCGTWCYFFERVAGGIAADALEPEKQTNEERFCQLPTEEKAKVFANATYSTAEAPVGILVGGKEAEQKKWEMWLKAVHKE